MRQPVHPGLRPLLGLALLAACAGGDVTGPVAPPPGGGPPPVSASARWSDPATWGGSVPAAGAEVTIPAGRNVLLDVSPPALRSLTIRGALVFDDTKDLDLTAEWILVDGGNLQVGTPTRPYRRRAVITLTGTDNTASVQGMGAKVLGVTGGVLDLHGEPRVTWAKLAQTVPAGATSITLDRDHGWRVGETIVIASTDFEPLWAEEAVVTAVNGRTVSLDRALRWAHWGELQSVGGVQLDERAEVGLLSHNVTVRGDSATSASGFGGHVMGMQGATLRVSGTEFLRLGQKAALARYPIHWHLMGDAPGQYVIGSSIWRSNNRCITIHGTNDVRLEANVCYDHLGHGYFLEDGDEQRNVLERNLGLATKVPATGEQLLASDSRPATYWITHPNNTLRGNVAAGSRGFGFWYALPDQPTGLSTGRITWPRRSPLGEFTDNVAHSNRSAGLNVDDGPRADGTTETVSYQPREVPSATSNPVVAVFRNFTGYKHAGRAVWLRGRDHRLVGAILADNAIGATFASSETMIQDATIIGLSANRQASQLGATTAIRGYEFYDGRVGAERVTFVNFQPDGTTRPVSALGYNRNNHFPINVGNYAEGLRFQDANRLWLDDPRPDRDGDKAAVFLDRDGSVSGTANAFVIANNPILVSPGCQRQDPWNSWVCTNRFVNVRVESRGAENIIPFTWTRDDGASNAMTGTPNNTKSASMSLPAARRFTVAWTAGAVPDTTRISLNGMGATDFVRLVVPFPVASAFRVIRDFNTGAPLAEAASEAALDASAGELYWVDRTAGTVHLKAAPRSGNTSVTYQLETR